jgi:hypothetical protein
MLKRNLNPAIKNDNPHQVETTHAISGTVFSSREAMQAKEGIRLVLKASHQIARELRDPRLTALALRGMLYVRALT